MAMGGNKIRKLEFLLARAIESGADCVVTIGGHQSNHARATALCASTLGLDTHMVLRTSDPTVNPGWVGNLFFDRLVDAHLYLVSKRQYARWGQTRLVERVASELRAQGRSPYIIPVGGSVVDGIWGYLDAVDEIRDQILQQNLQIDDVVFATGSGGTAAGLSIGSHLSKAPWSVFASAVCDQDRYFYDHVQENIEQLGVREVCARDIIHVTDRYRGPAYGTATDEQLALIAEITKQTGILCDPCYVGKALQALLSEERFRDRNVLFLHTGGMLGVYEPSYIRAYDAATGSTVRPLFEQGKDEEEMLSPE